VQTIDFLPERYRELQAVQQNRVWRKIVLVLFGSTIAAAAIWQGAALRGAHKLLMLASPQAAAAADNAQRLARLDAELNDARATAQLLAWLHHPWPVSQLLETVAEGADERIKLTELRYQHERAERQVALREEASQPATAVQTLTASQRDLATLREEVAKLTPTIELRGAADDATALLAYVARLDESPLVTKSEVLSLESSAPGAAEGESSREAGVRFVVRLWITPASAAEGPADSKAALAALPKPHEAAAP
jgi:hypothetical protein